MSSIISSNLQQDLQGAHKLNRKTTKIEFLSQENQQLREQVQELQNIVKLNKEALKIAMQSQSEQSTSHYNNENSFQKSNNLYSSGHMTENPKVLSLVLQTLYQENDALIKINEKITEERNVAQSKALINEQISEASQKHEKELILDLEEKVFNLTKKVKEQEQLIYSYEKTMPDYDSISGIVIKYRDVINISDQTLRMHDENEKLNMIILKITRENSNLKSDKQELVKINMHMSNEILRLKATLAAPHGRFAYVPNQNQGAPVAAQGAEVIAASKGPDFIKIHKKLMKNGNSDEEDNDEEDDMESEIDVLPEKATMYTEGGTASTNPKALGLNIPKLDLAKALKIQEINAKKSTMQQLQKQQGSDIGAVCQQLKKTEADLTIAKKNLQREMLLNKTLQIENENLKRFNVELESRNETLVSSHNVYEEKWQKIFQAFQYYREFYKKNYNQNQQQNIQQQRSNRSQTNKSIMGIDMLNSSSYTTTQNRYISTNGNNFVTQNININDSQIGVDPDKLLTSKIMSRGNLAGQKLPDSRSILELNNNEINLDEEIFKIDPLSQKEYAKNYLLNIAKDVFGMFNKHKLSSNLSPQPKKQGQNSLQQNQYKLKRSLSNPLDYMNEHGKEMVIQSNDQHLDRSDIGMGMRNYTTYIGNDQSEPRSTQKYKDLNDVINNQEILIQFTEQTDEKSINNLGAIGLTPIKPQQLND